MSEHKRLFFLIFIMAAACLVVTGVTITVLYRAAFREERSRLVETAQNQARLIETITRFDIMHEEVDPGSYPEGPLAATLEKVLDAHKKYKGFGETGEFTFARREGDHIVFLFAPRHSDLGLPKPIPFASELAEPMRRALSGLSGTVIGQDNHGERVLAAHEPVAELNYGIVAKIDLSEVRAPFVRAGLMAGGFAVLVIFTGAAAFLRIINPIIRRLKAHTHQLQEMMAALRKAHNELEMRVGERTATLSKTNAALEKEIAERVKAESALVESERKYRTLFESAPVGISITSFDGRVLATNDRLLDMMGYSREDIDAQRLNVKDVYSDPTDRETLLKQVRTAGFTRDVELELRRKNGSLLQACVSLTLFMYGGQEALLTVFDDISERKADLEKLQQTSAELRHLSDQLIDAQEKERRRIALELHDSIGQMLSAIRISVDNVLDRMKTGCGLDLAAESLASVISMTRQAIEEVRRISMALRPSMLDDLGVLPTISWFFRDYQKVYSGIQIKPDIDIRENEVPAELKTPIFRILQEALNNIAKHSRADSVRFHLGRVDNRLEMKINDNGRGFFLGENDAGGFSRKGLGLTSMRERAKHSGGEFFMDSVKGFGTSVRVSWPLETVAGVEAGKREEP